MREKGGSCCRHRTKGFIQWPSRARNRGHHFGSRRKDPPRDAVVVVGLGGIILGAARGDMAVVNSGTSIGTIDY